MKSILASLLSYIVLLSLISKDVHSSHLYRFKQKTRIDNEAQNVMNFRGHSDDFKDSSVPLSNDKLDTNNSEIKLRDTFRIVDSILSSGLANRKAADESMYSDDINPEYKRGDSDSINADNGLEAILRKGILNDISDQQNSEELDMSKNYVSLENDQIDSNVDLAAEENFVVNDEAVMNNRLPYSQDVKNTRVNISSRSLSLSIDPATGDYTLHINDKQWLQGAKTFFTVDGNCVNASQGGGLRVSGHYVDSGNDNLGPWSSTVLQYVSVEKHFGSLDIRAEFRWYEDVPDVFLFGQHFLSGINGSHNIHGGDLSSGFPSFYVDPSSLGYLAYGGIMFGDTNKATGMWNPTEVGRIHSGLDSGPLVLFDGTGPSMVVSPFSSFMAMSSSINLSNKQRPTASWGVMGTATSIPQDYSVWTIICYSPDGVNKVMEKWGQVLRKKYNRGTEYTNSDLTNNYIGYYTDNGAYYYYLTEPGASYEKTLYMIKDYAANLSIPFRYIQYDSWFYPKGPDNGVIEWVSMPKIFPSGMKSLWNKTGWISVAHNRWWSDETVYAKQNGGAYEFIVERDTHKALPLDLKFWMDLMQESRKWGLILYEQDWLNDQFNQMKATVSNVLIGEKWLTQMGVAALNNGLNIQYCMAPSRAAFMSLLVHNVVQARVSVDYCPGNDQWKIGLSSMLAHALGVAPFKDNFWTTSVQPGNVYNSTEPHPDLQSVVATLSTGPVAPADKIGYSDRELIMRSCNADGLILKPSKPATSVDGQLYRNTMHGFKGEVWTTYSDISGLRFGVIFAANFNKTDFFPLSPEQAGFGKEFPNSVVFSWFSPSLSVTKPFTSTEPLVLSGCYLKQFCLYLTSPVITVGSSKIILGGEMNKWVAMSPRRISAIERSNSELMLSLLGASGEMVTFNYSLNGSVESLSCVLSIDGRAKLLLVTKRCIVY